MDSSRDHHKDESTLRDDEFQISHQESYLEQSSVCYCRRGEGVPFQWEKQPGTPKNPPKEDVNIINLPLSPPPSFQSRGLSKPCFDNEPQQSKHLKVWLYKKIKKPLKSFGKSHQNSHDSFNNSSSSSTDSFASNTKERDKSATITRDFMDDPYCCNLTSMDKEEASLSDRKMQMSGEALFVSKILSRMSSVDHSSHSYYRSTEGIPFKWEMQPGTPIHTPQNEVIPPPSPPPMIQSLALPKPCIPHHQEETDKTTSTWGRIKRMIKTTDHQKELSFRQQQSSHRGDVVLSSSSSSSSSLSSSISKKKVLPLSKFRRHVLGGKFCFNPWKIKTNLAASNSLRRI
ncbi:hypothetical protein HAX54_022879 [Datura stramonium]|uniref:Uncharacterized protein n=1 Tax=Datura stramonium TaxID=4076 RepID=A0ABS8UX81_DATST|nr:hypothetical protein [Datura stramonium]